MMAKTRRDLGRRGMVSAAQKSSTMKTEEGLLDLATRSLANSSTWTEVEEMTVQLESVEERGTVHVCRQTL